MATLISDSLAGMRDEVVCCCEGDLLQASRVFGLPSPYGQVRSSPWVRATPRLWTVAEAQERVREFAENTWAAIYASRPKGSRYVNGKNIEDVRPNPFAIRESVSQ